MDPNTTLANFRSAVRRWQEAAVADDSADRYTAALDAVEAAIQLDRWLSRGGFLPTAWRTAPVTREAER
jgi:hypothetical protein